jgi:3-oxoacyl-[acyl-carrier protein] reductase
MSMISLENKVAVITGGGGGIGSEIGRHLSALGARIVVTHLGDSDLDHAQKAIASFSGAGHLVVQASVDSYDDNKRLAAVLDQEYGRVDLLVNNAGVTRFVNPDDLEGLDDELIDTIFRVNWRGSFATIRALQPLLKKSEDGLVVNISSIAGTTGIGSNVAYCASKTAINTMTISLARSLSPDIRMLAIAPGLVEGEYTKKLDPAWTTEQEELTPLKRLTQASDVARAVVACATLLTFSTGCVIPVDGGRPLT